MEIDPTATNGRQLRGWCPSCRQTHSVSPRQATEERQGSSAYHCDNCGEATHEPVIRLTPPFMEASGGLGD